jgi:hypothetical protein
MEKNVQGSAVALIIGLSSLSVAAADFDGSKPLLCATFDAHSCDPGVTCERSLPSAIGAPQFLRLDFSKKTVTSAARSTPMRVIEKDAGEILLQGTERGFAWTIVLDSTDGAISATLVSRDDANVLFGACTPD